MEKTAMIILMGALFTAGVVMETSAAVPSSINKNVPGTMNYQGRLVGSTGTPYADGTYTFDIRLFSAANGGTPLWGGTYSSYVKDGYFNVMLGASGGAAITANPLPTHTHTLLWKALWPDASNGNPSDSLYLGVTPWQAANGSVIASGSRTELSPRQTLMTAPYAFRAQIADSANRANANFDVTGTITADDLDVDGDLFRTIGTQVYVGGPSGNITANEVNINAKAVDIDAGIYDLRMNSSDNVYLTAANDMTLTSADNMGFYSSGYYFISGTDNIQLSTPGPIYLSASTEVKGRGEMKWTSPGSSAYAKPFTLVSYDVVVDSGSSYEAYSTGILSSSYSCTIVGMSGSDHPLEDFSMYESGGVWFIRIGFDGLAGFDDHINVRVMRINNNFVDDQR